MMSQPCLYVYITSSSCTYGRLDIQLFTPLSGQPVQLRLTVADPPLLGLPLGKHPGPPLLGRRPCWTEGRVIGPKAVLSPSLGSAPRARVIRGPKAVSPLSRSRFVSSRLASFLSALSLSLASLRSRFSSYCVLYVYCTRSADLAATPTTFPRFRVPR